MVTKFRKRKKAGFSGGVFFSILVGILILGAVGFLIFQNIKIGQKRTKLTYQIEILRKELQGLEEKNRLLKTGISQSDDEEHIKEVLREELGYQEEGETTVGFTLPEAEKEEEKEEEGFWKNLWQKVFGE